MDIQSDIKLANFTSFRIGGAAKYFVEARSTEELRAALEYALQNNLRYFVLGGGTNMLVQDQGFPGLAIKNIAKGKSVEDGLVVAETGNTLAEINIFANNNGFVGFEQLATVPGTLGGAIYNNAHYLNSLLSDFIAWVEVLVVENGKVGLKRIAKEQLSFTYDSSKIKTENLIAVRAGLKLQSGDIKQSRQNLLELIKKRNSSQPYGTMNSGCMFQNVKEQIGPGYHGTSAGYLIDQCGLKGAKVGDAEISTVHGNFFINTKNASSEDILKLAEMCQNAVREKFHVNLEFEIKIIN